MTTPELFYGLKKRPFDKNIDVKDLFHSQAFKEAVSRLDYMKQRRGLMLLTGQSGTGKTTSLRYFVESLKKDFYEPFYIPLSTVNILDFYRQINSMLGAQYKHSKAALFASIQESIIHRAHDLKKVPVIILDEAHLLHTGNFPELQIICNFKMDSRDPALFILSGQTYLREKLVRPIFNSFVQRISLKYDVEPLLSTETGPYIQHHLLIAGTELKLFTDGAVDAIHTNTAGIQRAVGDLAWKSLTLGAIEKKEVITEEEVYRALQEM
jgi:type II secretory pathway predicted ATPase ExeA